MTGRMMSEFWGLCISGFSHFMNAIFHPMFLNQWAVRAYPAAGDGGANYAAQTTFKERGIPSRRWCIASD